MIKRKIKDLLPWTNIYNKIYIHYKREKKLLKINKHLAKIHSYIIFKKFNCFISPQANIGKNLVCPHPTGIVIGEGVKIGNDVTIYQNVTIGRKNKDKAEYPTIGNNVIIYTNSVIIGNVKIGNNAIIGCNSVVLRDVSEGEVVCGVVK